jgi:hypothetical protein
MDVYSTKICLNTFVFVEGNMGRREYFDFNILVLGVHVYYVLGLVYFYNLYFDFNIQVLSKYFYFVL